jgi:hypothetical protein
MPLILKTVLFAAKEARVVWREMSIGARDFISDTIKTGYVVPFQTHPPSMFQKNNRPALDNVEFVQQTTADLLETSCIQKVPFQPFVISSSSVAVNERSGKMRHIFDLSEF